jgi:hypothetical protein
LDIRGRKWQEVGEECLMRSFVTWTLHQIYSGIKSMRMRWAENLERMREMINAYKMLVGIPEGKKLLRKHRRRWEDNTRMDLSEIK